ncbi:hypothetical protein FKM82_005112 [Ascaphus truei]
MGWLFLSLYVIKFVRRLALSPYAATPIRSYFTLCWELFVIVLIVLYTRYYHLTGIIVLIVLYTRYYHLTGIILGGALFCML